jgi:hypothetical protein
VWSDSVDEGGEGASERDVHGERMAAGGYLCNMKNLRGCLSGKSTMSRECLSFWKCVPFEKLWLSMLGGGAKVYIATQQAAREGNTDCEELLDINLV